MGEDISCHYSKYGYCKFQDRCRKRHFNEVCENEDCEVWMCDKRHPKVCRYYSIYGHFKFQPCAYKHVRPTDRRLSSTLDTLENSLEQSRAEVDELKTLVINLSDRLIEAETFIQDFINGSYYLPAAQSSELDVSDANFKAKLQALKVDWAVEKEDAMTQCHLTPKNSGLVAGAVGAFPPWSFKTP